MPALTISPEDLQKGLDILAAAAVTVTGEPVALGSTFEDPYRGQRRLTGASTACKNRSRFRGEKWVPARKQLLTTVI